MDNMPPLPPKIALIAWHYHEGESTAFGYVADQMHEYAREYAEQRCAPLVEALTKLMRWLPVYPKSADFIVGAHAAYDAAVLFARAALDAEQEHSK